MPGELLSRLLDGETADERGASDRDGVGVLVGVVTEPIVSSSSPCEAGGFVDTEDPADSELSGSSSVTASWLELEVVMLCVGATGSGRGAP